MIDNDEFGTENAALISAMEQLHKPHVLTVGSIEVFAVPKGMELKSTKPFEDERRIAPERTKGTARLSDLPSFLAHVARFGTDASAIYANVTPKAPSLTAVYDYHAKGAPAFGEHRAVFTFPLSEAWKAWTSKDGAQMSQGDFATWLEDHAHEVTDPAAPQVEAARVALERLDLRVGLPSEVLTVSRGLTVRQETVVSESFRTSTGEMRFVYDETVKGEKGEPLTTPGGFVVAVPVFDGDDAYPLPVRLRFRVTKGAVTWSFALLNADDVIRDAIKEAVEKVRASAGVPVFLGSPE